MKATNITYLVKQTALKCAVFFFISTCLPVSRLSAQIQGGVFDMKKQGIANALVIATDSSGHVMDSVMSDKRGFYIFRGLRPGRYRIEARSTGFHNSIYENILANKEKPVHEDTRVDISNATRLEIVLKPSNPPK